MRLLRAGSRVVATGLSAVLAVVVSTDVSGQAAAAAPDSIGAAETVVRQVAGVLDTGRRDIVVKDPVYFQEAIETGPESLATLRFRDDTTLTTGANSKVTLDEFVYAGGNQKAAVTISKGIMRFVTGSMASSAYEYRTPTAIIGVRGTKGVIGAEDGETKLVTCEAGLVFVTLSSGTTVEVTPGTCIAFDPGAPGPRACTPEEEAEAAAVAAQQKVNGQGDDDDFAIAAGNFGLYNAARKNAVSDQPSCPGC